ncbi:RDD family protein [Actinoplanes subtropicus]|uniref:RDD family protein n=1 Tax=Actinoplanes subtropicus TaxID=543632 RepID=UPI0012F7EF4E|nr:RDD family protein [Actinoplanes subtropicus]
MSETPAGFPNPPHANGQPPISGHQQAYGQPTHQHGPTYSAPPQAYGSPGGVAPHTYGNPVSPAYLPGQAVQPYQPTAPAMRQPQPVPAAYPQAAGPALVSAGGRFGAMLLDGLLAVVTLWIGWLVWSMFTWSDGQTPAKKLLGHVVADANTGSAFDWGRMALREFCIKGLLGWVLNVFTLGIYFWVDSFMCFGDRQRTLHDRMANSIVRYL